MDKCKQGCVEEKPPESHNSQAWVGFIVETIFLYGNTDENNPDKGKYSASSGVKAKRVVKNING